MRSQKDRHYLCTKRSLSLRKGHLTLGTRKIGRKTIIGNGFYRIIHKSLRDFQPLRYSSREGHAEGEHVNRGRDTPSFCPTLQVLDMSTLLCLSVLVYAQPSSEVPEGLTNNPVYINYPYILDFKLSPCSIYNVFFWIIPRRLGCNS